MDTEKHLELEKKIKNGESPNDEGPYYHVGWWESYKGGVKGKLGGAIIGGLVGTIVGAVLIGALAVASVPLTGVVPYLAVALFTGIGVTKGYQEFSEVGHIVGSGAAQTRLLEARLRTMMDGKVAEMKEEIGEVKEMISGQPNQNKAKLREIQAAANEDENQYRKSHYAKLKPVKFNSLAFWKVALIGLAVGAAIGLALSIGGAAGPAGLMLGHVLGEAAIHSIGYTGITLASTTTLGALGATYGLNRDFFRKIFDKTDLLFKGLIGTRAHQLVKEDQIEAGKTVEEKLNNKENCKTEAIATSVVPDYMAEKNSPVSQTHWRDKVLPAAQRTLLSFDHTRATPQ
ncbi:MAG: hypothetical protein SFW63_05575 [Alphaproteobacteria bacterium]|nr:hypothetical protein [Alphaproteobacteria bacterium]